MSWQISPAADWSAEALAAGFTAAFEGYVAGQFVLTAASLPGFMRRQGNDLALSRCVVHDGQLAGIAFVGEFDGRRRVGGMGLRAEARGSGMARALLQQVIDEARRDGMASLELEVFVQNTPALRLYRALGFVDGPALWGFARAPAGPVDAPPEPVEVLPHEEAADWLLAHGPADLPFQVSGHGLRRADPQMTCWRIGRAIMLFGEAPQQAQVFVALLVDTDRLQHDAAQLLAALLHAHPSHQVHVPPLMRDDVAGDALRRNGFTPLALHQQQMRLMLAA